MSTRHVLYINEFFHPDICASAAVLIDQLPRIAALRPDWRVTVLAGNRAWDSPDTIYPPEDSFRGVHIVRIPRPPVSRTSLLRRGFGFWHFGRGVLRAARSLGPIDLVVGTTAPPHGGQIAARIAREHRCRLVYRVLDLYPDLAASLGRTREGSWLHRRWLARDTAVMRAADAVVTVAERITRRIAATRNADPSRLHTLHDGFDAARLRFDGPNLFRQRHNPDGRFVVQYAGNMGLSHPFEAVVDAARRLAGEPGILFQFVGGGPGVEFLRQRLPPGTQLLGYQPVEALGQVLDTADVCLISQDPAMFDKSLPYKVYASLAAGRPVVFLGNPESEIVEWLSASGAGLQIDQNRGDELAAAIRSLRDDNARRAQMSFAARALFERRFGADAAAQRWLEILSPILK